MALRPPHWPTLQAIRYMATRRPMAERRNQACDRRVSRRPDGVSLPRARWIIAPFLAICLLTAGPQIGAQPPSATQSEAQVQTQAALQRALAGDPTQQMVLLREVIQKWPDYAPARWQVGQLRQDNRWRPVADAAQANVWNIPLAQYLQRRDQLQNPGDELALGLWCRDAKMPDRAQLHLEQVVTHPDSTPAEREAAAKALDIRPVDGLLLTAQQAEEYQQLKQELNAAAAKWLPQLYGWQERLRSGRTRQTRIALEEISQVTDEDLWTAALLMGPDLGDELAAAILPPLLKSDTVTRTRVLAEIASSPRAAALRAQAIKALRDRPMEEYVPYLLDKMESPVTARFRIYHDAVGNVRYLHDILQNDKDESRVVQIDSPIAPHQVVPLTIPQRTADGRVVAGSRLFDMSPDYGTGVINGIVLASQAAARQQQAVANNASIQEQNAPVFETLEGTSGVLLQRRPEDWHAWWDHQNLVTVNPQNKPVRYAYLNLRSGDLQFKPFAATPFRHTWLSADTPVWTETGRRPISQIRRGDKVLAQDVASGQIDWKVVRHVSAKSADQFSGWGTGERHIAASAGVLFWVAGKGWVPFGKLQPDQPIYGLTGLTPFTPAQLDAAPSAGYHLVVDDYGTFFIGPHQLLVHDDQAAEPVKVALPGVVR